MNRTEIVAPEWQGILRPQERILWQGAPQSDLPYREIKPLEIVVGIGLLGYWTYFCLSQISAAESAEEVVLILVVMPVLAALLFYGTIGRHLLAAAKVRSSFYTLTSQRAFIGWFLFRLRRLEEWPITAQTKLELDESRPFFASVYFAEKTHREKHGSWIEKIGFHNIADAAGVYALLLLVQRSEA